MKRTVLFAACLLISLSMFSQIEFSNEKFGSAQDGYVINKDGKKINGTILYEHPVVLSKEVLFNGTIHKPGDLQGFFVDDIHWISVTDKKEEKFAPTDEYGPMTVYWLMSYVEGTENPNQDSEWTYVEYITKFDWEEPIVATSLMLGFKKKMSEYVSDYPELSQKVAKKEKGYGALAYMRIIEEYNTWYLEQNPDFAMVKEAEEEPLPESSIKLPEGLYGKWQSDNYTFTIGKNSIKFDYQVSEGSTVNTEYLIEEYIEELGFISGKLIKYNSMGFDAMEGYPDHSGFVSFTELTENTVRMYFQGHGVIGNADKAAVQSKPEDFKFMAGEYSRVE